MLEFGDGHSLLSLRMGKGELTRNGHYTHLWKSLPHVHYLCSTRRIRMTAFYGSALPKHIQYAKLPGLYIPISEIFSCVANTKRRSALVAITGAHLPTN